MVSRDAPEEASMHSLFCGASRPNPQVTAVLALICHKV
jgi:hypothetical protein